MATYSYDPAMLGEYSVDRMRFELGDTEVAMGALTSPLCDEEYAMLLELHKDWRRAKIACLRAIMMHHAHEVDTTVDGLSYSLSDRFDRWRALLDEEEGKLRNAASVPVVNGSAVSGKPYFYAGMHANRRRS